MTSRNVDLNAAANDGRRMLRRTAELADVVEFLEEVRLRPGMWVRGGSLEHLESMLVGYRVALDVHGIAEEFDFWPGGRFTEWLCAKLGRHSSLSWSARIEREAAAAGLNPMDVFFNFLDEYLDDRRKSGSRD